VNVQRLWIIGTAIVAVAVLALGWFLGVQPQLSAKASTDEQRAGVEAQNTSTELVVARLAKDFDNLDALESQRDALRVSIPAIDSTSRFLQQVDVLAEASGTVVTEVTTSETTAYTPPVADLPAEDGEGEEADGEAEDAEVPEAPVEPLAPPVITDPLVTSENFFATKVTVAVTGSNEAVIDFVDRLQHGERLCLVTQLQIALDTDTGLFTATATGFVYVLVNAAAADAG
jgi:hypothetical protein